MFAAKLLCDCILAGALRSSDTQYSCCPVFETKALWKSTVLLTRTSDLELAFALFRAGDLDRYDATHGSDTSF